MKALYYPRFDQLEIRDLEVPEPGTGEVLLKVDACGLCGSELETFKNRSVRRAPPLVMGHEFCGVVESVGGDVPGDLMGRRFIANSIISCDDCPACCSGDTHLCAHRKLFGMHLAGGFAEYVSVPSKVLIPWPEGLEAQAACLAEPLGNGIHVVNLTRHLTVRSAIVIGAGPIGLMCQQALQSLRGVKVMVCDVSPGRLEIAAKLGAARTICSKDSDLAVEARKWVEGAGVDLVVDAAGSSMTKKLSLEALRPGGAAVWMGLHQNTMELDSYEVTLPEKQILGTYGVKKEEFAQALDLMSKGSVDVTSWVDAVPLSHGVEEFHRMLRPSDADLKVVFIP